MDSKYGTVDAEYRDDVLTIAKEYQQAVETALADRTTIADEFTAKLTDAHKRFMDRCDNASQSEHKQVP
jgi:hypothetical protein